MKNVTATDPLEILIEREEMEMIEAMDDKKIVPCLVLVPNSFARDFADPLENLIALSDPSEVLRQAIIN